MPVSGVYSIKNKINHKLYIGSSISILERFGKHRLCLRKGIYHNIHLQSSWEKYGENNFDFEIIESNIPKNLLEERENFYIVKFGIGNTETDFFNPPKGYNMSWAGKTGFLDPKKIKRGKDHPNFGKPGAKHTAESKRKMSETRTGKSFNRRSLTKIHGPEKAAEINKRNSERQKGKSWSGARRLARERGLL